VRREIYIMRSLSHKHIVRMYEALTSNTKLYIVMELVTGGELFDRLERHGRVDETLARQYIQQLVDGVDICHKSGVAHRDLKPENLLIDASGDIKITDFGFSAMKSVDANAGIIYTQCSTPDYCAPEIIERVDEGYNGAKVDVLSCGIILYALLVGRLPFREEQTDKLYELILACQVA
jgi:serine/threonine protein kinase